MHGDTNSQRNVLGGLLFHGMAQHGYTVVSEDILVNDSVFLFQIPVTNIAVYNRPKTLDILMAPLVDNSRLLHASSCHRSFPKLEICDRNERSRRPITAHFRDVQFRRTGQSRP
jgi:hypothetical protein